MVLFNTLKCIIMSDLKYANFLEINMFHMLFEYQKVLGA